MSRERLHPTRFGKTAKFRFCVGKPDEVRGYVTANTYPDGRLGEVFIVLDRAGSVLRVFADALALSTSVRLQRGETISEIADKFIGIRSEPAGATGNPTVPRASSVLDFVYRWLMKTYAAEEYAKKYGEPAVLEEEKGAAS